MKPAAGVGHAVGHAVGRKVAEIFSAAPGLAPAAAPARPRKLWELESKHHCPLIGTCLTLDELTKFARRYPFSGDRQDEFSLHVEAAARAGTRNELSEAIHKHLDRKYASTRQRFAAARSDEDVLALWQAHYARGEVAGALWAALTHKAASAPTRQVVYGDIHMLSHQVGAGQAADARRLAHMEKENAELRAALERETRARTRAEAAGRAELQALQAENHRLQTGAAETAGLRTRLAAFESGEAFVAVGRQLASLQAANAQLIAGARRAGELERQLAALAEELPRLRAERDQLAGERDALERVLLAAEPAAPECAGDCAGCAQAGPTRSVLCVGGRTALIAQYRSLAERLGIRLIHHDGGQEEAISRLPDLINGADAVICPTDCVSHSAYYRLKRHCKLTGKPCLLFKGAGVSSFAVALSRLSSGRVSVAGEGLRSP